MEEIFLASLDQDPFRFDKLSGYEERKSFLDDVFLWEVLLTQILPGHVSGIEKLNLKSLWTVDMPRVVDGLVEKFSALKPIPTKLILQTMKKFWGEIFETNNLLIPRFDNGKITMQFSSSPTDGLPLLFSSIKDFVGGYAIRLDENDCRLLEEKGKMISTFHGITYFVYGVAALLPDDAMSTTPSLRLTLELFTESFGHIEVAGLSDSDVVTSIVVDKMHSGLSHLSNAKKRTSHICNDNPSDDSQTISTTSVLEEVSLKANEDNSLIIPVRLCACVILLLVVDEYILKFILLVCSLFCQVITSTSTAGKKTIISDTMSERPKKLIKTQTVHPVFENVLDTIRSYRPSSAEQEYRTNPKPEMNLYRQKVHNSTNLTDEWEFNSWTIKVTKLPKLSHGRSYLDGQVVVEAYLFHKKSEVALCYLEKSRSTADSLDLSKYFFVEGTERKGYYLMVLVLLLVGFRQKNEDFIGNPSMINFTFLHDRDDWIKKWASEAMDSLFKIFHEETKRYSFESVKFYPLTIREKKTKIGYHCQFLK